MSTALAHSRKAEVFDLTCWSCGRPVEIACQALEFQCPRCDASLAIQWCEKPLGTGNTEAMETTRSAACQA